MIKPSRKNIFIIFISLLAFGFLVALVVENYPLRLVVPVEPLFPLETERPNRHPFTVAHRGAALHAPDNSLAALKEAIALGFDYVEIDVRYTSDNIPVLMHDRTIDRTTNGSGGVAKTSYAELKKLDAGSWFSEEFAGIRVPSLEDALKLMEGKICVFWHAKAPVQKEAVDLFHKYGFTSNDCVAITLIMRPPEVFESNLRSLNRLWLNPPLVVPIKQVDSLPEILEKYPNVRFLAVEARFAKPELVDAAHAVGLKLYTRTVWAGYDDGFYKRALDAGVDGLLLADIENLRRFLREYPQQETEADLSTKIKSP